MNPVSKKRTILFSAFFLLVVAFALFHHTLICYGVKFFLNSRLPQGETLVVNYEKGKWEDGAFVLHQVNLSRKSAEQSTGFNIKIESLRFLVSLQFFPFHFGSRIVIDSPEIALLGGAHEQKRKKKGFYAQFQRDFFKKEMVINRGKIEFNQEDPTQAYFSIRTKQGKGKQGELRLACCEKELEKAPLIIDFSTQEKDSYFDVHFDQLDLPWMFSIARFFSIPLDPGIKLSGGKLSGELAFGLRSENQISHVQYELELSDFTLNHTRYGVVFAAHKVNWKEHFTSNEEMGRWSSHPFFEKIWPYFIGDGEFFGAKIAFEDPLSGEHQGTIELRGKVQFTTRNQPLIDFYGLFSKGSYEYPLRIVGEGFIESNHNWKLAVDLSLHQEDGEKMTSYFALTSQGVKKYLFESRFQNISLDPADLVQYLVKIKYPHMAPFEVEKGTLSGCLVGWVHHKRFQRLEFKEFKGQHVLLRDRNRDYCFSARQLKGCGEFDFSTPDFFDGTFWEIEIVEGNFKGPGEMQVMNLSADFSMHDQYIKPSVISGAVNGIEGGIRIEGLYTHLNLNLDFDLSPHNLFLLLGHEKQVRGSHLEEKLILDFDMHLKTTKQQVAVDGLLQIIGEKKEADTIVFGAKWNAEDLLNLGFLKGLSLGWFKADHLSSRFYNLPLEFFEKGWRGEGYAAIEGTFNSERIALSFDPTHVRYLSPYLILEAGYGEEKAPTCNFCYEFEKKYWSGKIPLKKAKLIERNFGIEFDSFSSEIDLAGLVFDFQNVTAHTNGVYFEGAISLDYQYEDYAELIISTDKVKGSTKAIQRFLRIFKPFASLDLPLDGEVYSEKGGMTLRAFVGDREEMQSWKVSMALQDGAYTITPTCSFEKLATRFEWSWSDQTLHLLDSDGYLRLGGVEAPKLYHLNIPVAHADFKQGDWSYDLRLETPTHDICRFAGKAKHDKKQEEMRLLIDPELTRFFGAKVDFREFALGMNGAINRLDFETDLSSRDLYHHLDFLVHAGLVPLKATALEEMQSPRFEGSTHLKFSFCREDETFLFDAQSDHFAFGTIDLEGLLIHAVREGSQFKLERFKAGSLSMHAHMIKESETWNIPSFDFDWKKCKLRGGKGFFHKEKGYVQLPLNNLHVDLSELLRVIPNLGDYDLSYFKGLISSNGILELNLSHGFRKWDLAAHLEIIGKEFSKGNLRLESEHPLHFHFSPEEGFEIGRANINFFHPRSNQLWAKCQLSSLCYKNDTKKWDGKGFKVVLPPEMLAHLAATRALPYLSAEEGCLVLFQNPFKWDNQMELSFDFSLGDDTEVSGRLKEGYYWISDRAWYLNDFCYHWKGGDLDFKMNTLLDDHPFDLHAQVSLLPHFKSRITIQETIQEEQSSGKPLTIISNWSDNEGFFIQSVEGAVCGLGFSFHHNPKGSFLDQMTLTGQVKIDIPTFAKYLPNKMQETIQAFEIGKGYEISGDCILSKEKLLNSHFTGYLKGKKFELMGSEMETLLSEITIHPDHIELSHFNMSDASGIFSIDDIRITKMPAGDWTVTIPNLAVQDFRPSLLKKVGRYRGRIKPMTIRDMSFRNIRGKLGDAKSFTGTGSLNFTNTFKRDYNIFDIPFEILGRLGLDMGLLVPIRGHLDYIVTDGKIFFTQLLDSYSEGKRSKFYLSPAEASYIDFDGTLNINIKMKQYVLLKITEPFTLSIAGTFEDIRYFLK